MLMKDLSKKNRFSLAGLTLLFVLAVMPISTVLACSCPIGKYVIQCKEDGSAICADGTTIPPISKKESWIDYTCDACDNPLYTGAGNLSNPIYNP